MLRKLLQALANLRRLLAMALMVPLGAWLVADGLHAALTGSYLGPAEYGAWGDVVKAIGIEPQYMAIPFVLYGLLWFVCTWALWHRRAWGPQMVVILSLASLWQVFLGTAVSVCLLVLYIVGGRTP